MCMNNPIESRSVKNVCAKINQMQKMSNSLNWEKDKMLATTSMRYAYLSAEKTKANVARLLAENGLVFTYKMSSIEQRAAIGLSLTTHWTAEFRGTIYDVESGESISSVVYCEAADSVDKAASKLATNGYKLFWFNTLSIADGFDNEDIASSTDRVSPSQARMSNVGIPQTNPQPNATVKEEEKTVPKAVPKAVPKTVPKAKPTATEGETPSQPAPQQTAEPVAPSDADTMALAPISEIQRNTIENIVKRRPDLQAKADSLKTARDAKEFLNTYI